MKPLQTVDAWDELKAWFDRVDEMRSFLRKQKLTSLYDTSHPYIGRSTRSFNLYGILTHDKAKRLALDLESEFPDARIYIMPPSQFNEYISVRLFF